MWFKRKPKNRRTGREHVLDVKLRSSQVRAARSRLVAWILAVSFFTVFGLYLSWRGSEWALAQLIYENPAFAVEEVDVQTDGIISLEQLRRWTGITKGQNLLALDLARLKRDLELVPIIHSVSVERILPHTIRLRVIEREPVAQATALQPGSAGGIETKVLLLDAEGYVMLPLDPHQRANPSNVGADPLPIIAGINPPELQPGRRIEAPSVRAALQLLLEYERSPMAARVDLARIDVSSPDTLLVTTEQGSSIVFPLTNLGQQLRRWCEIYDFGQRNTKAIATLDLAVTNNIPAVWLEANTVPSPSPKASKTLRNKRKHV